ncbi:uncharacterized protein LOC128558685 [Mercenaria mercenaria]|uniref:uncharacterized protein LOC128558685 n=1 Tax=Mercenaria mercenaria TaxID=6596 RepID=UPI00234F7A39|nr:uncharacterized protein LOC128558685 [Mercenaria mercenaria]
MKNESCILVLVLLCIRCYARIEREHAFEIDSLSPDSVAVDIQSDIPGQITWIYTDDHNFRLKVKIIGENENSVNSTDIHLITTNSSVKLAVREKYFPVVPSPVTGSGSALRIPAYLVWFLVLLIGWNNPMAVLLIAVVYGFTPGTADMIYDIPKKTVQIEVTAPRRLSYRTVNLYINGGKLRVVDWEPERAEVVTCETETAAGGCPNCCHGNGVCVGNQCICDENYNQESNCALGNAQAVFFSHPLDPRFDRTLLPNSDVLTLGRAFQFIQQPPYLKDPDVYTMEIKSRDDTFSHILIIFHPDGFIEKILDTGSMKNDAIKFKRSRLKSCLIRLKGNLINTEINICDKTNSAQNIENDRTSKENGGRESTSDRKRDKEHRRKSTRNRQRLKFPYEFKFVEFPVRIHRCGYNSQDRKHVYFQLLKEKMDPSHVSGSQTRRSLSFRVNENIILLPHETSDGTVVLRLPNNSVPLGSKEITSKCEMTKSLHRKICFPSNLENFRIVCNSIFNLSDINHSTPPHISRTIQLCRFVLESVTSYCDKHIFETVSQDKPCLANYINNFNLFSEHSYQLRPIAHFPDEKVMYGYVQDVNFANNTQLGQGSKELTITDNDANFKIVKISVIPTDPVPHDIYQVKLEYACATSQTVIKMTVYGSDYYSNSVTCHGTTQCSCCILHAAGAPNAVVDHVTINVTDPSRNYKLVQEMVVVF